MAGTIAAAPVYEVDILRTFAERPELYGDEGREEEKAFRCIGTHLTEASAGARQNWGRPYWVISTSADQVEMDYRRTPARHSKQIDVVIVEHRRREPRPFPNT